MAVGLLRRELTLSFAKDGLYTKPEARQVLLACYDKFEFPLTDEEISNLIAAHLKFSKEIAMKNLDVLDGELIKPQNPLFDSLAPRIKKVGNCAKGSTLFYAVTLIVLSVLMATNRISFPIFGGLMIAASSINLLIQWGTPYINLRRLQIKGKDPKNDFSIFISHEFLRPFREFEELLYHPLQKEFEKVASFNALKCKISPAEMMSKHCKFLIYKQINKPLEILNDENPSWLPEVASLIHTISVILFVVLGYKNLLSNHYAMLGILTTLPAALVSSLCLQKTFEKRILNPMLERKLTQSEATTIKHHLTNVIEAVCH